MQDSVTKEEVFAQAFDMLPSGLLVGNSQGRVLFANAQACLWLGLEKQEVLAGDLLSFFEPLEEEGLSLNDYWEGEVRLAGRGGQGEFRLTLSSVSAPSLSHKHYLVVLEEKSVHPVVRRPRSSTEAIKSDVVTMGAVAHDLNNVLTGILGHLSFLRLCLPQHGSHAESLRAIEDGARRASRMAQQVLDRARGKALSLDKVNVSEVLLGAIGILKGVLPENISISVTGCECEAWVMGEESQLGQVFLNLFMNAKDAMPSGGSIQVFVEHVRFSQDVEVEGFRLVPGDYCRVRIVDTGVGIPQELRSKIFEAFFTTKTGRGTGLGLATVMSIVESHRGAISLASAEGEGTEFSVYVPAAEEGATEKKSSQTAPAGKETVLVVDDEEVVRTIMHRSLEHLGYTVESVPHGVQALERFKLDPHRYQLVVLDMIMPHMGGDEVFMALRKIRPQVRVLIASGYASDDRTRRVLEGGALGFLQKPFSVEELAKEVRRCLDVRFGDSSR